MKDSSRHWIGFPPPLLGIKPLRLEVLCVKNGLLGLEKPKGILIDAHPWHTNYPAIIPALRSQIATKKPELDNFKLKHLYAAYPLDPEITGIALLITDKYYLDKYRNAYGSFAFHFRFNFLALHNQTVEDSLECHLPLCPHSQEKRMFVSHKRGKRASTHFKKIAQHDQYDLWQAETQYLRPHQIRIHAAESDLKMIGETLYTSRKATQPPAPKQSLKPKHPASQGIDLHLKEILWEKEIVISPLPKKMLVPMGVIKSAG